MNAETLGRIGLLRDKADNFIALRQLPLPDKMKIQSAEQCIDEMRAELESIYKENGGSE